MDFSCFHFNVSVVWKSLVKRNCSRYHARMRFKKRNSALSLSVYPWGFKQDMFECDFSHPQRWTLSPWTKDFRMSPFQIQIIITSRAPRNAHIWEWKVIDGKQKKIPNDKKRRNLCSALKIICFCGVWKRSNPIWRVVDVKLYGAWVLDLSKIRTTGKSLMFKISAIRLDFPSGFSLISF